MRTTFQVLQDAWTSDDGQDIAEYAVMLAVILVLVIGPVRLVGGKRKQCVFERCQQHAIGKELRAALPGRPRPSHRTEFVVFP